MSENPPYHKIVFEEGTTYSLNNEDKTCEIIKIDGYLGRVKNIPRSVNYRFNEYIIKSINENAFDQCNYKYIEFADDSEVEKFKKNIFEDSNIESLTIPSSLIELEEGWCNNAKCLKTIKISPNNPKYFLYQDTFILTKSNSEKENYDVLVFCRRDIEEVKIPDFIEIIGSYSFNYCKVKKVEFSKDSKLRIIEPHAFSYSSITTITIPPNRVEFKESWCENTDFLNNFILIEDNNNYFNYENKFILTKSSPEKENFDVLLFSVRDITSATIPNYVEIIGSFAFYNCKKLQQIKFDQFFFFKKSNLRIIDNYAFYNTMIKSISIPPLVTRIGNRAFAYCHDLKTVDIPKNSELQTIEEYAFANTSIEKFTIPSNLTFLKEGSLDNSFQISLMPNNTNYVIYNSDFLLGKSNPEKENFDVIVYYLSNKTNAFIPNFIEVIGPWSFAKCSNLIHIEFESDSKLKKIGRFAFYKSSIESILIPSNVTTIESCAFKLCNNLKKVEFQQNSQLQTIESYAFAESKIEEISIPSSVTRIDGGSFAKCYQLQKAEFDSNSKLDKIDRSLFMKTKIQEIKIPSSVKTICQSAFIYCKSLKHIKIPKDSELRIIESKSFDQTPIENIIIPSKFVEINDENWYFQKIYLNTIEVSPDNQLYSLYDNKLLLKKSSVEKENFDVLVFCARNAKEVIIPKHVEIIEKFAFDRCFHLKKVDIPYDSKLQIIDSFAFIRSAIHNFSIPSTVKYIGDDTFGGCSLLEKFIIPEDSELKIIGYAFCGTSIKSFSIPSKVTKIHRETFNDCPKLQIVEIHENFDILSFYFWFSKSPNCIIMIPTKSRDKLLKLMEQNE